MNPVRVWKQLWLGTPAVAAAMLIGCALPMNRGPSQMAVWARSHNRSTVDVYLLCGDRDARWLGVLRPNGAEALDLPSDRDPCVQGLNFFLVDRDHNRGYWVGPLHPRADSQMELVIEKYAGLSTANVLR
jgi:hypothetical protein